MIKKIFILLILLQLSFLQSSYADDNNALRKLARGIINGGFCWLEVPRQMIKVNSEHGDIAGFCLGALKGSAFFVGRAFVGLYEVSTFLIPPYKPVVEPEFIFSEKYYQEEE
ncbi:MAG: exosortase system-associated protein, TIGR04073 family [Candidatus Omnitrophota bacterium]